MDEIALFGIWCLFEETACAEGFLGLVVLLALSEEALFLFGFNDERGYGDGAEFVLVWIRYLSKEEKHTSS